VRLLFLSQRVPFPPDRGDKIPTSWIVQWLARRHEVTCIAFAHGRRDVEAARVLEGKGIPTIAVPFHGAMARLRSLPRLVGDRPLTLSVFASPALQREVDRRIPDIDLGFAFSSSMGAFLLPHPQIARVMHFADVDSDKWRQYASHTLPPMRWVYTREWHTLERFERTIASAFDESLFCTSHERELFRERVADARTSVLRNGVDLEFFQPPPLARASMEIVFTGVMNYFPNVDACRYFVEEVLPRVQARHPDASFTIVGAYPTRAVRRLAQTPGVTVTGRVDDTRPYLRRAALFAAPLRIARGIQNKVLEAMAMGLPVVGTSAATQGIEGAAEGTFVVADTPEAQAAAIGELLAAPARAQAIGASGRRFVETHHRWEECLLDLENVIARALARKAARK